MVETIRNQNIVEINRENLKSFIPYLTLECAKEAYLGYGYALGYVVDNVACGAIATRFEINTPVIASIYVDEKVRRKGIGTKLLEEMCYQLSLLEEIDKEVQIIYELEGELLSVMDRFLEEVWGGKISSIAETFKITLRDIENTNFYKRYCKNTRNLEAVICVENLSPELIKYLSSEQIPAYARYGERFEFARYDLSYAWVENGEIKTHVLVFMEDEGVTFTAYASSQSNYNFFGVMAKTAEAILNSFDNDKILKIQCLNEVSSGLVKRLLGTKYKVCETHKHICYFV